MKNIAICLITIQIAFTVHAKAYTQIVTVQNWSFIPASFNINLGDTVMWVWVNGFHTTSSYTIPSGTPQWNANITSTSPTYVYIPLTGLGHTYYYRDNQNNTVLGNFTVSTVTGISNIVPLPEVHLSCYNSDVGELSIAFSIPIDTKANLMIYDIAGKVVQAINIHDTCSKQINIADLPKGLYILELITTQTRILKKVFIQ